MLPQVSFIRQQVAPEPQQKKEGYLQKNVSLLQMNDSLLQIKVDCV